MKRAWFLCAMLALSVGIFAASRFTPAASAQDDKPSIKEGETSIEVRVKADTALPAAATNKTDAGVEASADATTIVVSGSTVTISGTTAVDGKQMNVKLTVTPPDGEAQELTALADAKGDFAAKFTATIAEGDYQVEAVSPDGKGTAQTTLRVLLPAAVGRDGDGGDRPLERGERSGRDSRRVGRQAANVATAGRVVEQAESAQA